MEHNNCYKDDDEDSMFHMKIISYQVYNRLYSLPKILALFVIIEAVVINLNWMFDGVQMSMRLLRTWLATFVL